MSGAPVDVTAVRLEQARETLAEAGLELASVSHTRPPGRSADDGESRVVRQRLTADGRVELVVASAPRGPAETDDAP